MNTFLAALVLSCSVLALVPRQTPCCFHLDASGGVAGTVGQLGDGQNRVGGGLAPADYCITNGAITDSNGRGCILTRKYIVFLAKEALELTLIVSTDHSTSVRCRCYTHIRLRNRL